MLLNDMLAKKIVPLFPYPVFDVTAVWRGLPEYGWEKEAGRLILHTPSIPPYPLSWWEWAETSYARSGFVLQHFLDDVAMAAFIAEIPVSDGRKAYIKALSQFADHGATQFGQIGAFAQNGPYIEQVAALTIAWDAQGVLIRREGGVLIIGSKTPAAATLLDDPDGKAVTNMAWQVAYMCGLLHVKNIVTDRHDPEPKLQRARIRRGKPPLVSYHTLRVVAPGTKKDAAPAGPTEHKGMMPLHLVRGHFSHYTEAAPLFGRYTGTFWIPAHIRGERENGLALKDYKVVPQKGAAA